ncbi:MAG: MHYT domain-containing protein [Actinophytocola sp.]|uniref:MHYT domain-containing protein n=1 Tax=Actinophytocola sp. TaxID=1872138 RepID=UPI003D6C1A0A
MNHVHHFDLGTWLMFFAYATSVVGSTVGLACTPLARYARSEAARLGWLALAAVAIGGVGIWLMHFIAMLGFTTPGLPVRYDVGRTAISAVLAVGAVFVGLLVFGARRRYSLWRLLVGGTITGLAVALMHYTGMWALNVKGSISYDFGLVVLSVAIAVLAATAALWFTVATDRLPLRVLAGLVMGIAVTGMHYTGMAAVRANLDPNAPSPEGVEVFTFLLPVFVVAAVALAGTITAVLMAAPVEPDEPEPVEEEPALGEPVGSPG